MDCPSCGAGMASFPVHRDARHHAPDGADAVAVCPTCLTVTSAEAPGTRTESGVLEDALPDGESAGTMAVAIGLLADSVALNGDAILALFGIVADTGVDPWLVLERLDGDPDIAPELDIDRAYRQLQQLS